jgi:hypothetical protein
MEKKSKNKRKIINHFFLKDVYTTSFYKKRFRILLYNLSKFIFNVNYIDLGLDSKGSKYLL